MITPPASPLQMPTQVLESRPDAKRSANSARTRFARFITFGGCLLLTVLGSFQMFEILFQSANGALVNQTYGAVQTALLWLLLGLFTITFAWISLTAMAAIAGVLLARDKRLAAPNAPLRGRTVLLMPVHNEQPANVMAALRAMAEDLAQTDQACHFEIFIVSDTRDAAIAEQEIVEVNRLRAQLAGVMPVWYRRRDQNTARKAGNIRDFINRWGDRYDYMVVLDADSLIAGTTLTTLVREMDADPDTGLIQTLPRLYGGSTLYARLQQFSGVIYGPVFARGLNAWQGDDGNYWGHNAIVRVRAFASSAGLPSMPGRKPFGGEIRSHDFVEAALLRRAGWTVRMLPELGGSWEESPPTLLDAAVRDRRWAQGNVQHLAVVSAKGLSWASRAHMLMGVMNYLISPFWLALVVTGLLLSAGDSGFAFGLQLDAARMMGLLWVTLLLLLLPKLLGMTYALFRPELHAQSGRLRLVVSGFLELLLSILYAPIVMLIHTRHLWEIAMGRDSGWSAQQRQGGRIDWRTLSRQHLSHTLVGITMAASLLLWSPALLLWMLPMVIGLSMATPLSALSGSKSVACWLRRHRILLTPEEGAEPHIMQRQSLY